MTKTITEGLAWAIEQATAGRYLKWVGKEVAVRCTPAGIECEWYRGESFSDDDMSTSVRMLPIRSGSVRVLKTYAYDDAGSVPDDFQAIVNSPDMLARKAAAKADAATAEEAAKAAAEAKDNRWAATFEAEYLPGLKVKPVSEWEEDDLWDASRYCRTSFMSGKEASPERLVELWAIGDAYWGPRLGR